MKDCKTVQKRKQEKNLKRLESGRSVKNYVEEMEKHRNTDDSETSDRKDYKY